uniref:Nuf2 DHR10-like domain-containing protein n=1 Tax=Peronospora matthiolae TaxID=2874970 RepID=A0AAV1UU00_9STRA
MIERLHGFETELARRLGQDHVFRELKTALSEAEKKFEQVEDLRTRELPAAQQQVEAMTLRLAAAKHNLGGDLQAATSKTSKYKKLFHRVDKKLDTTRMELKNMTKSHQDCLREQGIVEVELQRMRSDLADRNAQMDRLRNQALNWEQQCL